jgi:hypothetical protein
MTYTTLNLTNSSRNDNPIEGDYLEYTYENGNVTRQHYHEPLVLSESELLEQTKAESRSWRNVELQSTDWIVSLTDHPERDAYMTYRQALRDWPSTDNFPDNKPTL